MEGDLTAKEENMDNLECGMEIEEKITKRQRKIKKGKKIQKTALNNLKQKILEILDKSNFRTKRSAKIPWIEFVELLNLFNQNEIYF